MLERVRELLGVITEDDDAVLARRLRLRDGQVSLWSQDSKYIAVVIHLYPPVYYQDLDPVLEYPEVVLRQQRDEQVVDFLQ